MTLPPPETVRKILVRVNNWIGDVIMISPAMRALRRRYPGAEITLLAKPWVLDALRGSPDYDRLLEYDRSGIHAGLSGRWRLIRALRREHFDLAVLFQKAFEAAFLAWTAGIPRRLGFRSDGRSWLLTQTLEEPARGHRVDHFLKIVEVLGCDISDRRPSFHLDQASRDSAARFLRDNQADGPGPRVALHPGASKPPRSWHPERFAGVASRLERDYGARILLLGAEWDRPVLDRIAKVAGSAALLAPAGQSLREMAALLERCHLLICNDSGPMHVAAALRTPVVAIFGPGHPARTGPFVAPELRRILSADYPCSPCRQRFFRECVPSASGKPYCLEDIREEDVMRACAELMTDRERSSVG